MKKEFTAVEMIVVVAAICILIGLLLSVTSDGSGKKNFVSEPTPVPQTVTPKTVTQQTVTPEAVPNHENLVNQKFTKVPRNQINEWLVNCKERVVCITPLMHNVLNDLIIDSYLVVTEPK